MNKIFTAIASLIIVTPLFAQVQLGKNVQIGGGSGQGAGTVGAGTSGQFAQYPSNGNTVQGVSMTGDGSLSLGGAFTLSTVNGAPGTCGDSTHYPTFAVNMKGLTTSCTPMSFPSPALFPGTNGIVFNTSPTASRNTTFSDIVPLWGSGSCTGYLKSDGTCGAGGGTSVGSQGTLQAAGSTAGTFAAGTATNVMNTLGNPPGMNVFGDSISYGEGPPNYSLGYAWLLKPQIGGPFNNQSVIGQLCVAVNSAIISNQANTPGSPNLINECGTNDVTTYNSNANLQTVFQRIFEGNVLFGSLPLANVKFAQTCTKTTGFGNANDAFRQGMAQYTVASGDVLTCSVTTTANGEIAIGYVITTGGTGTFTVKVNGVTQNDQFTASPTFLSYGDGSSNFTSGVANNAVVGQVFSGFTPNASATVTFTSTAASTTAAPVEIAYIASIPSTLPSNETLVISPNHQNNANDTLSGTYAGYEQTITAALVTDGLNLVYVNTRDGMVSDPNCGNGSVSTMYTNCYADLIHPNTAGAVSMDKIVEAAVPGLLTGAPTDLFNGSAYPYPVNASTAPTPAGWWTPNPQNLLGDGNLTWPGGGVNLGGKGTAFGFTDYDPTHGATLAGPGIGSSASASMCTYNATHYPATPNLLGTYCPIWVSSANFAEIGTRNTDGKGGMIAAGGSVFFNNPGSIAVGSVGNTFFNADSFYDAQNTATSSQNYNSVNQWFVMSGWNGSAAGSADVGLRGAIGAGTTPTMSLQLATNNNPTPLPFNLDISAATAPNLLGNAIFGTSANGITVTTGGSGSISGAQALSAGWNITNAGQATFANAFVSGEFGNTPVPATSGANKGSIPFAWNNTYWDGTSSQNDTWTAATVMGAGTTPTSTLTFQHAGPGIGLITGPNLPQAYINNASTAVIGIKLLNGTASLSSGALSVTFPTSMFTAIPHCTATLIDGGASPGATEPALAFSGITASGFTLIASDAASTKGIGWICMGN